MKWTRIDLTTHITFFKPRSWSTDALYCHESDKDCLNCPIFKNMGWTWGNGKCKQPISVQQLLDRETKQRLPRSTEAHHKVSLWQKDS